MFSKNKIHINLIFGALTILLLLILVAPKTSAAVWEGPDPANIYSAYPAGMDATSKTLYTTWGRRADYVVSRDGYTDIKTTRIKIYVDESVTSRTYLRIYDYKMCPNSSYHDNDVLNTIRNYDQDYSYVDTGKGANEYVLDATRTSGLSIRVSGAAGIWDRATDCYKDYVDIPMTVTADRKIVDGLNMREYTLIARDVISQTNYPGIISTGSFLNMFHIEVRNPSNTGVESNAIISYDSSNSAQEFGMQTSIPIPKGHGTDVYSTWDFPFAPDCGYITPKQEEIVIYDDDNGDDGIQGPVPFSVQVMKEINGNWLPIGLSKIDQYDNAGNTITDSLTNTAMANNGWVVYNLTSNPTSASDNMYYFTTGNKGYTHLKWTPSVGAKYKLVINNVYFNNTLQIKMPFNTVFALKKCAEPTVEPRSAASHTIAYVDDPVIFYHYIKNEQFTGVPYSVKWRPRQQTSAVGQPGSMTGAAYLTTQATLRTISSSNSNKEETVLYTNPAWKPKPQDVGKTVCQDLELSEVTAPGKIIKSPSDMACVYIAARPGITPSINAPNIIEAGDPFTFEHSVIGENIGSDVTGTYEIKKTMITPAGVRGSSTTVQSATSFTVSNNTSLVLKTDPILGTETRDLAIGTQICESLKISNLSGGARLSIYPNDTIEKCVTIAARPYVKFFGSDVVTSCPNNYDIYASAKIDGSSYVGSSAQYAVRAIGSINGPGAAGKHGFYSRSQYATSATGGARQLTFANTTAANIFGGGYGGSDDCEDVFSLEDNRVGGNWTRTNSDIPGSGIRGYQTTLPTTNFTLNRNYSYTGQGATYVDGNVLIAGNIIYANSSNWPNAKAIPSYRLIVKGNIYIDPNVTRLDGYYFATGKIYTCATSGTFSNFTQCNSQLTVYGSLNAMGGIKYWRTAGTVNRVTDINENINPLGNWTNVAEKIILSPELYFSLWEAPVISSPFGGAYDSIESLPPIF